MAYITKKAISARRKKSTTPYGRLVVIDNKKGEIRANLISRDGNVLPIIIVGFSPDEGNGEKTRVPYRKGAVYTYLARSNIAISADDIIKIRSRKKLNFEGDDGNKEKRKIIIGKGR